MKALVVERGDRDRVYAVRVTVEIALVPITTSISAGKDEDRAQTLPPVLHAVNDRLLNEIPWRLHGSSVIWGPPTAREDRRVLVAEV